MPSTHNKTSRREKENGSRSQAKRKAGSTTGREPLRSRNDGADDAAARIRELEAQVRQTEAKLQETEARLREGDPALPPPPPRADTLPRPKRVSEVTMAEIQDELGFDKLKWIDLRSYTRDCLSAARLNPKLNWKAQDPSKLGMAYNAIEADFPQLRRFEGKWGVERITKDTWDNRKSYKKCRDNPATYVARRIASRRESRRRRSSPPTSPRLSPRNSSPPRSHSPRNQSPGPSQPRPRPHRRRIESDDDLQFSDGPDAEQEEDEEVSGEKGRKRTKSGGGSPSKRCKE
ncbi:hypothetical protein C8J57DRAFT_1472945 [Mycena rebaudengoi]|nr:hypothetical protein C8J57DRAFT_1472945 [Mycena rebaudengoi]